ncbi:MAG: hypothetical protein AAFX99_28090, partial [Myxococcota bacterium]
VQTPTYVTRAQASLGCAVLWGLAVVLAPVVHSVHHHGNDHHHLPGGAIVFHEHDGVLHADPPPLLLFDAISPDRDGGRDATPLPPHGDGSFAHFAVGVVVPLPTLVDGLVLSVQCDPIHALVDALLPPTRLWLTRGMARAPPLVV